MFDDIMTAIATALFLLPAILGPVLLTMGIVAGVRELRKRHLMKKRSVR